MSTIRIDRPRPEIAVLTLDRPERLNALTFEMVDELHGALDEIGADNDCRVLVITGEGRGFCSGLDLKEIRPSSASERGCRATGPVSGARRTSPSSFLTWGASSSR